MMHLEQDIFNDQRLATTTAESSTTGATWFAVLEERRRMAREIHDTLAQAFAGILLQLEAVPERGGTDGPFGSDSVERLARAKGLAKSGLEDSRRMLLGLRPKSLDSASLMEALQALAQHCASEWRILCKFGFVGQKTDLAPEVQDELYRIAQEALCNVHKHSRATAVSILFSCQRNVVALTIKDNGQGFVNQRPNTASEGFGLSSMRERAIRPGSSMSESLRVTPSIEDDGVGFATAKPQNQNHGFGMATMRERAQRIGGRLRVESRFGGGTTIRVEVPMSANRSKRKWVYEKGQNQDHGGR